jgi:deoxyribose-phosphate aldolase
VTKANLASLIDHTLLKADATKEEIIQLCKEAKQHQFASVCVNPTWVKACAQQLKGSTVKVCTVIGFPLGATTSEVKAFETKQAIGDGATEVDMVINIGALKVIIETSLLTEEEIVRASIISQKMGADYVKTSTGFSSGGATTSDVALMRKAVGPDLGVKASGGIRDRQAVLDMVQAGATRIGASSGVSIVQGEESSPETDY